MILSSNDYPVLITENSATQNRFTVAKMRSSLYSPSNALEHKMSKLLSLTEILNYVPFFFIQAKADCRNEKITSQGDFWIREGNIGPRLHPRGEQSWRWDLCHTSSVQTRVSKTKKDIKIKYYKGNQYSMTIINYLSFRSKHRK